MKGKVVVYSWWKGIGIKFFIRFVSDKKSGVFGRDFEIGWLFGCKDKSMKKL